MKSSFIDFLMSPYICPDVDLNHLRDGKLVKILMRIRDLGASDADIHIGFQPTRTYDHHMTEGISETICEYIIYKKALPQSYLKVVEVMKKSKKSEFIIDHRTYDDEEAELTILKWMLEIIEN